eukprot:2825948-Pyramimonas_sp.AAC.1
MRRVVMGKRSCEKEKGPLFGSLSGRRIGRFSLLPQNPPEARKTSLRTAQRLSEPLSEVLSQDLSR